MTPDIGNAQSKEVTGKLTFVLQIVRVNERMKYTK